MKNVFLITDDAALRRSVEQCAQAHRLDVQATAQWADARDILIKTHFDAVFIDYEVMKLEGLDAFILLDNVLQKESTIASLILRKPSARASQFIDSLASFGPAIELDGKPPTPETLQAPFDACVRSATKAAPQQDVNQSSHGPLLVEVHLTTAREGTFADVSLARALYTLAFTAASGTLFLKHDTLEHHYPVFEGRLRRPYDARYSPLSTLAKSFAWSRGSYRFTPEPIADGPTEDPYRFIYLSIERHMPSREVMQAMMPHMRAFPVRTNHWQARTESLRDLAILHRFMQACDGQTTLERALGSLGADATRGFQAALYAVETDLLSLRAEPTFQSVSIQYNREIARFRQQQVDAQTKDSKAYRARGSGRASLEAELTEFLERLEHATPYEIFGVWEGCGREIIRSKFYEMVKQHHPDVYGGNISGDVKRLVQEIFITIKDTYEELMKIEGEQRRPRPEPTPADHAPGPRLGNPRSFGSESAPTRPAIPRAMPHTSTSRADAPRPKLSQPKATPSAGADATAPTSSRQSRIERLKVKRSATPIGLGREPSTPIIAAKPRARTESQADRRAKFARIRTNSSGGRSNTGMLRAADTAANAFNEGYSAWREGDNTKLAAERFATAYNLEPGNGKYMTFYGYFLFLQDAANLDDALRTVEKAIEFKDRQSLPDAHVFMGHLLKVKEEHKKALRHYQIALRLNPKSRDALRAIRLYEKRHGEAGNADSSPFWKNLFKK